MTFTLEPWMTVPLVLTALILCAMAYEKFTNVLVAEDVKAFAIVWAVLMVVSLLSIWSAT